jgi:hypothetical protein
VRLAGRLNQGNFFVAEAVELVDKLVDFAVGVLDLVLTEERLVLSQLHYVAAMNLIFRCIVTFAEASLSKSGDAKGRP